MLDAFCGGGGSARGYMKAGWMVTGVDNAYDLSPAPFQRVNADAVTFIQRYGDIYKFIHASPPCQLYTRAGKLREAQGKKPSEKVDLVGPTRGALAATGRPWVIENVPGAPVRKDLMLCGSMFGLKVRRHRWFEFSNRSLIPPQPDCNHKEQGRPVGVYHVLGDNIPHGGRTARTLEEAQEAMGELALPWKELKQAIPWQYTYYIGMHVKNLLTPLDM